MAKKAKKLHTKKGVELKIVNPNAAGIDIADTEMQVCVPTDRDTPRAGSSRNGGFRGIGGTHE